MCRAVLRGVGPFVQLIQLNKKLPNFFHKGCGNLSENLSRQVDGKAAVPQTVQPVQPVRQGTANAASGLTRQVLK